MRTLLPALALVLTACPEKKDPEPSAPAVKLHDPSVKRDFPEPLAERPFTTPTTETRTLSNGMKVVVATNNEVPLVDVRMAFSVGAWNDEIPGQAQVTFDMLNEGAGDLTAAQISGQLKAMASDLSTGAGTDGSAISIATLKANLEPTLDLMELVVEQPTFPSDEWELMKKRYVAAVLQARKDPNQIASRVADVPFYGDAYRGRIVMESDYEKLDPATMKAWYGKYVGPQNAILLVGGDVTADEIVPLLEKRFGDWKPEGIESPEPAFEPAVPDASVVYFVDKPGAAQSVVRAYTIVGEETDADWFSWSMGVDVLGGSFMSRLNMNLREDKGYTYGARCGTSTRYGANLAYCAASVQTAVTGPSLVEMKKELDQIRAGADRPISEEELVYMRGTRVNGYPRRFETPSALLGEQETIWRYGLPEDWAERYLPGVQGVSVSDAQQALDARWDPERTVWLVVGDKTTVYEDLKAFGLPIKELDADGKPIGS